MKIKRCAKCNKEFESDRARRRFCSNSCSAKAREGRITKKYGHRRPFRREISDARIRAALRLTISGMTLAEVSAKTGIDVGTIRKRGMEVGYRPGVRGTKWQKATLKLSRSQIDRAYIAALLDSEGSIVRVEFNGQIAWRISIVNTHRPVLEWLASFGGRLHDRSLKKRLGAKAIYVWNLSGQHDVLLFLKSIVPYARIKKEKMIAALSELQSVVDSLCV